MAHKYEVAKGHHPEYLSAGARPLFATRLLLSRTAGASQAELCVMVLGVSCVFLYTKRKDGKGTVWNPGTSSRQGWRSRGEPWRH